LVTGVDTAVTAVERVGEISRQACRADVLARFTSDAMIDRYLALFAAILGGPPVPC
jgi:hypothetical protein